MTARDGTTRKRLPLRRRILVLLAVLVAASLALTLSVATRDRVPGSSPAPGSAVVPGRPYVAYSEDSFFRTPLSDDAPVDPESDEGIAWISRVNDLPYPVIRGTEGDRWGMPFALATCEDPVWRLTGRVPEEVSFLATEGFHAPRDFADSLTRTSDSPFVVIDRCGTPAMPQGLTVWGFRAAPGGAETTLSVRNAGAYQHDSNGLDRRNPRSDSALNFTGRGSIPDAMPIRDDELAWAMERQGDLGHVLHVYWWETDTKAGFVHPMVGEESGKKGFGAEGTRIRIRPEIDLAARQCTPAGLVVARTLQRFGGYLGDNAGGSTAIKAQQNGRLITSDALSCVTWTDFEFVRRGWDGGK